MMENLNSTFSMLFMTLAMEKELEEIKNIMLTNLNARKLFRAMTQKR